MKRCAFIDYFCLETKSHRDISLEYIELYVTASSLIKRFLLISTAMLDMIWEHWTRQQLLQGDNDQDRSYGTAPSVIYWWRKRWHLNKRLRLGERRGKTWEEIERHIQFFKAFKRSQRWRKGGDLAEINHRNLKMALPYYVRHSTFATTEELSQAFRGETQTHYYLPVINTKWEDERSDLNYL